MADLYGESYSEEEGSASGSLAEDATTEDGDGEEERAPYGESQPRRQRSASARSRGSANGGFDGRTGRSDEIFLPRELIPEVLEYTDDPKSALEAYGSTYKYAVINAARECKAERRRKRDTLSSCVQVSKRACRLACLARSELEDRNAYTTDMLASVIENYLMDWSQIVEGVLAVQGVRMGSRESGASVDLVRTISLYADNVLQAKVTSSGADKIVLAYQSGAGTISLDKYERAAGPTEIAERIIFRLSESDSYKDLDAFSILADLTLDLPLRWLDKASIVGVLERLYTPGQESDLALYKGRMVRFVTGRDYAGATERPGGDNDIERRGGGGTITAYEKNDILIKAEFLGDETKGIDIIIPPWLSIREKVERVIGAAKRATEDFGYSSDDASVSFVMGGALWFPIIRKRSPTYSPSEE